MQAPVLILYQVRFARCGCCAGGLERKCRRLAGGRADNGEPTSRPPVPGRGHLFQQGSPPSPPWCVRPGTPSFLSLHQKRNRRPVSGSPVGTKISKNRERRLDPIEPCLGRGYRQGGRGWCSDIGPWSAQGACLLQCSSFPEELNIGSRGVDEDLGIAQGRLVFETLPVESGRVEAGRFQRGQCAAPNAEIVDLSGACFLVQSGGILADRCRQACTDVGCRGR